MNNHYDSHALVIQFLEHTHDLDAGLAIEISGRFIGQQKRRIVR